MATPGFNLALFPFPFSLSLSYKLHSIPLSLSLALSLSLSLFFFSVLCYPSNSTEKIFFSNSWSSQFPFFFFSLRFSLSRKPNSSVGLCLSRVSGFRISQPKKLRNRLNIWRIEGLSFSDQRSSESSESQYRISSNSGIVRMGWEFVWETTKFVEFSLVYLRCPIFSFCWEREKKISRSWWIDGLYGYGGPSTYIYASVHFQVSSLFIECL